MKILYLHQYFVTPDMAGGTRSYEMARRFVARGHEVHMITSWFQSAPPHGERTWFTGNVDGIHVHWLPVLYSNRLGYWGRIRAFLRFAWQAGRRAAQVNGDVVFATSTPLTIALPAIYAKKRLKVPMVFEVRDLWPQLPIAVGALRNPAFICAAKWLERFAYRNATHVVALSPGMAAGVKAAAYDSSCITTIPNSSDLELFDPAHVTGKAFLSSHPELRDAPIVLYPGTLGKINGVLWFVELAAVMRSVNPGIQFVVIGDGSERETVTSRAAALGVAGVNFHMLEPMPKRELVSAYAAATVVMSSFLPLPEMEANSANKFFDALAAGKPVAINYGGWQKVLLRESGAGLALPRDVETAAKQLSDLIMDPERLQATGQAARKLAEERFSRDELSAQLEQVLVAAVGDSPFARESK